MIVEGIIQSVEAALYDYGDILDDNYSSMLAIPLLKFEGKK